MQARRLGLEADLEFWIFGDTEKLNRIWNGYGPDKWPECVRKIMTWFYRNFESTALIHDWDYEFADGTIDGWKTADDRFYDNARRQCNALYPACYPWMWPFRVIAYAKIRAAKLALDLGGYTAYNCAYKRRFEA